LNKIKYFFLIKKSAPTKMRFSAEGELAMLKEKKKKSYQVPQIPRMVCSPRAKKIWLEAK
jgi:hypothetical protein